MIKAALVYAASPPKAPQSPSAGSHILLALLICGHFQDEFKSSAPANVRAWVRAEDLSPDHVSRGELRIKVTRVECANQIASVALRCSSTSLEFKYLKNARPPGGTAHEPSAPDGYTDWGGATLCMTIGHDDGLGDPELWTVKAEERRAWTTETTLVDNNPRFRIFTLGQNLVADVSISDLSQPFVVPFTVAVPAVNYPPGL
ncbi:hypothetical protein B0H14DRAFT_3514965 [Mycena olivaceomarginata]|nr:hypothetical protein B0H14DRAFT_3514965 [Mycena olivaceomarginata]